MSTQNVDNKFPSVVDEKSKAETNRWTIQKVPPITRGVQANEGSYDPIVVSVGPYHHGKTGLKFMEEHKYKMARKFANGNPLENMYTKVNNVAQAAKKCYNCWDIDINDDILANFADEKFSQIMFLDGCFLLQFIYCTINKPQDLEMKNNFAACVKRDLFLLENQIPFLVLKELMSFRPESFHDWQELFTKFIATLTPQELKSCSSEFFLKWQKLFTKFIATLTPQHNDASRTGTDQKMLPAQRQDHQEISIEDDPAHLLEFTRTHLIGKCGEKDRGSGSSSNWSSYRSAKELKAVGIVFERSKTHHFTDVTFNSNICRGKLCLPPITVDDSTKSLLLNMVAYEACPYGPVDFGVTSYLCFLDSMIDHAEDVKELRSKKILLNFLGSDEQVADLFNQIADNLVPNPQTYADVKKNIEDHCQNKIKNWLAEFWHTHFTSPWTILAFIGAILVLVLTVIQTYKALYPPQV